MSRATVSLTVFACLLATAACADSTAPRSTGKASPNGASNTRYILASGESPGPGCEDLGNGLWLCDDGADALQTAPATAATPQAPATPDTSGDSQGDSDGDSQT